LKNQENNNYLRIFNSSSVMAFAALVNLLLGLLRTKVAALYIGIGGFGFLATFISIQTLFVSVTGMGIQACGSRSIAIGLADGNSVLAVRSSVVVARLSLISGWLGLSSLVIFNTLINQWSFEAQSHSLEIIFLGFAVFFLNISNGKIAILQGFGRITDIACITSISALAGTISAVLMYMYLGVNGIIPSLIAMALIQFITSEIFLKRLRISDVMMNWHETYLEAKKIIPLGVVSMISGFLGSVVTYITIALVIRSDGIEGVAIYSAAFALSAMFINFVLQAMSMDYFPHLSSLAHDRKSINSLINQQTEIGLLLGVPGILATVILAEYAVNFFYSPAFSSAEMLMYWFIVGCLARVISWPLGYVALALGKARLFFVIEVGFNALHLLFILVGIHFFGVIGAAKAFFLLYVLYIPVIYIVVKNLTGFQWSKPVKKMLISTLLLLIANLLLVQFVNSTYGLFLEFFILLFTCIIFLKILILKVGKDHKFFKMFF